MLTLFTIVLNGQPWIEKHLATFRRLSVPWQWRIVEGVAAPLGCTSWCQPMPDSLHRNGASVDGTHEYLRSIVDDRVRVTYRGEPWPGKLSMIQHAIDDVSDGVVMQVDADEFWNASQLETIYNVLRDCEPGTAARFRCRYWVGPRKIVTRSDGWTNGDAEWIRAWRWSPNVYFVRHEPPLVNAMHAMIQPAETERLGLTFDHYAYVDPNQIRMKETYYGYAGLTDAWNRLQDTVGEVCLREYFPFAVGAYAGDAP